MPQPYPRQTIGPISNGGYYSVEEFLNEITVYILNSVTVKALAVGLTDTSGNQVNPAPLAASTATLSSVSGSASTGTLVAANTSRKGLIIHNDSSAILYIAFAATATNSAFTIRLNPFDTYEMKTPLYSGVISGIWASATGAARITELT